MSDDDIPDWLKALILLGLGAIALSILVQIFSGTASPPPDRCPHCGAEIRKWARQCPRRKGRSCGDNRMILIYACVRGDREDLLARKLEKG